MHLANLNKRGHKRTAAVVKSDANQRAVEEKVSVSLGKRQRALVSVSHSHQVE